MPMITPTHAHPLSRLYRDAMANVAASVHVITTNGPAGSYGITMTAVTSVTDEPPTMIVCINRQAAIQPILRANGMLCVNVLAAHQRDVAEHFAGITHLDSAARFRQHHWQPGFGDQPQVAGALAHLSGHISAHHDMGSHTVFYVCIEHIQTAADTDAALLYYRRSFTHSAI